MKITLLGDSIRLIGYGTRVPELLGADFQVYQPAENGRFSKYTLRGVLREWKEDMAGSEIIHWNNGLWDAADSGDGVFSLPDEYVTNMLRIADFLQKNFKTVIFATSTPVAAKHPYLTNAVIGAYNELIVPKLAARGILINDLYALVFPQIDTFIRKDDQIHLTEAGIEACAAQVSKVILEACREEAK